MNESELVSFLHYSYEPSCSIELPVAVKLALGKEHYLPRGEHLQAELIGSFTTALEQELVSCDPDQIHVVPLSSGLDSRLILAGLLNSDRVSQENIHTVSFGVPGTWDYQLGQRVAEVAGVSNRSIDLSSESFDWSLGSIQKYVESQSAHTRVLDGYINSRVLDYVANGSIIWSGFMGDPSAGGHLVSDPAHNWNTACKCFAEKEMYCERLSPPNFDPVSRLPEEPFVSRNLLSYEEQLDFVHRQTCLIKPIVIHSERYRTPFMTAPWLNFVLNLPRQMRYERELFKKACLEEYPELFSVPSDANFGLPINETGIKRSAHRIKTKARSRLSQLLTTSYIHPGTNYIDFNLTMRQDTELRETMKDLIFRFDERNRMNWIDPLEIWSEHQSGADRTNAIRLMASAELHLGAST